MSTFLAALDLLHHPHGDESLLRVLQKFDWQEIDGDEQCAQLNFEYTIGLLKMRGLGPSNAPVEVINWIKSVLQAFPSLAAMVERKCAFLSPSPAVSPSVSALISFTDLHCRNHLLETVL